MFILMGYYLYQERETHFSFFHSISLQNVGWFAVAFGLLPLNFGIEAYRWMILMRPFYPEISLKYALKSILSGCALGYFTPNRLGEYVGRLISFEPEKRIEGSGALIIDRLGQMYATLIFGLIGGLCILLNPEGIMPAQLSPYEMIVEVVLFFMLGIVSLGTIIILKLSYTSKKKNQSFFPKSKLDNLSKKTTAGNNLKDKIYHFGYRLWNSFHLIPRKDLFISFQTSLIRYLVFSSQYVALLFGLGWAADGLMAYASVSTIFGLKSFFPSFGLAELGVRELIAQEVISTVMPGNKTIAIQATFGIYLINIVMPAATGILFIRYVGKRNKQILGDSDRK